MTRMFSWISHCGIKDGSQNLQFSSHFWQDSLHVHEECYGAVVAAHHALPHNTVTQ